MIRNYTKYMYYSIQFLITIIYKVDITVNFILDGENDI